MDNSLAVVPIFVNAGAAVLPALIAGAGSVIGVLLRPREMLRFCRRRPLVVLAVMAGIAAAVAATALLAGLGATARGDDRSAGAIDWPEVATRIIDRQRIAAAGGAVTDQATSRPARPFIYRDGPSRCGYDGGVVPVSLMPLWAYKPPDAMVFSSAAVLGTRLFGATCTLDPIGHYGSVFCLDVKSGREIWSRDSLTDPHTGQDTFLKAFFSSPAVTADGKYVVIGQGLHDDENCSLLCFRADTGKLHWQVPTPLHIEGSPAILGDLVVAGAGAIEGPDGRPRGDSGFVLAVRISDGKVLWRFAVADPESSPAIADDGICYIGSGFGGSEVVALRTEADDALSASGRKRVLWRAATPYPATGAVTLWGDMVIVGCGRGNYVQTAADPAGSVIAFNRHTGARLWEARMPDAVLGAVAAGDTRLICPVRNGEVVALRPADGEVIWRRRVNGRIPVLSGPALAGPVVYAVSRDGTLAVIDARRGSVRETHQLNDQGDPGLAVYSFSSPVIAGARVYVGSETGGLRCFVGTGAAE